MNEKTKALIREYGESLLIAFVLAMVIRSFVVQAFKIPTGSMIPTLIEGDRILVNKFIYRFTLPKRGETIVFKYPEPVGEINILGFKFDKEVAFIKRLIGLPNERLEIKNGRIYVNDLEVSDPRINSRIYYNRGEYGDVNQTITVPEHSLYVLGDNSGNSRDSRYWGFVPEKNLIGKAILIYWPLHRMRLIE